MTARKGRVAVCYTCAGSQMGSGPHLTIKTVITHNISHKTYILCIHLFLDYLSTFVELSLLRSVD